MQALQGIARPYSVIMQQAEQSLVFLALTPFQNDSMQVHAYLQVDVNANITAMPISIFQFFAGRSQRCVYSTTAATATRAPAAPMPIAGALCIAAPLACVEALVVLPVCVCVCVPLFEFVEPPFAVPAAPVVDAVVDAGVDVALLTEPAVMTTGK